MQSQTPTGNIILNKQNNINTQINDTKCKNLDEVLNLICQKTFEIYQNQHNISFKTFKQKITQYLNKNSINYGLGAMFGAFMGDALGSYLQFARHISTYQLNKAMEMPGGGTFSFLLPGQFTDDSQMASHLLKAISSNYDPKLQLKEQQNEIIIQIADQYRRWFQTNPFDIGITTRCALVQFKKLFQRVKPQESGKNYFQQELKPVLQRIVQKNQKSQSNGSLMRITPMPFFLSLIISNSKNQTSKSLQCFHNLIKNEINMTHGNEAIFQTSQAWVNLLTSLILRSQTSVKQIYNKFQQKYRNQQAKNDQVKLWIQNSYNGQMDAVPSMGWAKIAFTLGLQQLRQLFSQQQKQMIQEERQDFIKPQTFEKIMKHILFLGGDTDTNGAIVGGLIGSVLGFKNLPIKYLQKQFNLNIWDYPYKKGMSQCLKDRYKYEPRRQFLNAIKLIQKF